MGDTRAFELVQAKSRGRSVRVSLINSIRISRWHQASKAEHFNHQDSAKNSLITVSSFNLRESSTIFHDDKEIQGDPYIPLPRAQVPPS